MPQTTPMQSDVYLAAQQTEDVLDTQSGVAQSFNTMISQSDARRRQEMIERMRQRATQPLTPPPVEAGSPTPPLPSPPTSDPYATLTPNAPPPQDPHLTYNPYPEMHQSVISPLSATPTAPQVVAQPAQPEIPLSKPPEPPSEPTVSPGIINLANNSDLSIETIAHEANRIHQKESLPEDEVVISLR